MGLRGPNSTGDPSIRHEPEGQTSFFDPFNRFQLVTPTRFTAVPAVGTATLADVIAAWLECLPVPMGPHAGKNMVLYPWQREILAGLYPDNRRVRQGVLSVPRKNGKTGFAAALALCHLVGPLAEQMGEIYSAAADRQQAAIIHRLMVAIINDIPELRDRLIVRIFDKSIEDPITSSIYRALSADAGTKHGMSATFVICDELAQWHKRDLWDVLSTSGGARAHPLCLAISTQSARSDHVMSELVDYGLAVEQGAVEDPTFYGRLYAAPDDADPWDVDVWTAANPGLGTIRSLEELTSSATKAQRTRAQVPSFRNLYLNQRVAADAGFLPVADWLACADDFTLEDMAGETCVVGLDLASVADLAAMVAYFPSTGRVLGWGWVSEGTLDASDGRVPYRAWHEDGHVFGGGPTINKRAVVQWLGFLTGHCAVETVVYDKWAIAEFTRLMEEEGVYVATMEPFGQGYASMSPAIAALEAEILERRLSHNMNPLLTWTFQNLVVDTDPAGNRKFTKSKSRDKIDPMISLVMAVGQAAKTIVPNYDFSDTVLAL